MALTAFLAAPATESARLEREAYNGALMPRMALLLAALLLVCVPRLAGPQSPEPVRPVVIVTEIDGIIHPISAEYLIDAIDEADASEAALLVLILRTPGGLLESTRSIVSRMIAARTPVAVWVGPAGGRAASAGFFLLMAADVAVMAPGTHTGAAHPVSGSGEDMDETTSQKAAEDAAAYMRSIAEARGRNVELAAEGVMSSRAFTDSEALAANPPLIDFTATDINDLIAQLDAQDISRYDGTTATLRTANAQVRRVEMTRRQWFLSAIAHPQIAALLMTLGLLGLTVELWNPGLIAPGVAGGLCLLLAFFAFQILPVNTAGLLLIAFGIGLLVLELTVPSFGVLGVGGAISLVIGSVMMTDVVPGVQVSIGVLAPVMLGFAALFLLLGRLALKALRQPSATGAASLVGRTATTRTLVGPDVPGQVNLHGEIWSAVSQSAIGPHRPVRVLAVDGLMLTVDAVDPPHPQ